VLLALGAVSWSQVPLPADKANPLSTRGTVLDEGSVLSAEEQAALMGNVSPADKPNPLSMRDPVPEMPASGLLDEGSVFNPEEEALMAADIEDFRHRVGIPVFIVTANYIFGDTVDKFGGRLVTAWLEGKPGIVIVYERGSGQLNYSASPGTPEENDQLKSLFVIGTKAAGMMPEDASAAQRMRAAVQALTTAGETWKETGKVPSAEMVAAPVAETLPQKEEPLPEPPVDFVTDDADAFDLESEAALKSQLVKFHGRHDMDLYVLTYTMLPHTTAQARAEDLAHEWLNDRYGAVLVMNRGTAADEPSIGIAGSAKNDRLIAPAVLFKATERAREKAREIENSPRGSLADGLRGATEVMMETFVTRGAPALAERAHTTTSGQWNVLRGVAFALVAGTALLFLFHRVQERLENRSNRQFFFPNVTVGRRLGSPQGGGQVAGISFRKQVEQGSVSTL